jgi:hypothetical protein
MKTTIEVHGFEIKIDEMEDKVLVSAMKDGETIEEFELDVEGFENEDDDMGGMDAFGEEGDEEEDFGGEEEEDEDDDMEEEDDDMEEDEDEGKLESFSHFVKKRKK